MSVFEEFLFNLASGMMVTVSLVGAVAAPALAQAVKAEANQSTLVAVYLTQANSSEVLTDLDEQPSRLHRPQQQVHRQNPLGAVGCGQGRPRPSNFPR